MSRFSQIGQEICWDRGRPARNEREARKRIGAKDCAPVGAFAGEGARGPSKIMRGLPLLRSCVEFKHRDK